jgi:uncharacterized protein YdcH (DUF465 family)
MQYTALQNNKEIEILNGRIKNLEYVQIHCNNKEIENLKKEIVNLKIEIMNNHANHIELKHAYNKYLSECALKNDFDLELFYQYEHVTIEDVKPMYKDYTNKYYLNSLIDEVELTNLKNNEAIEVELTNLNEDKNND